ncbi:hypothetical protein AB5N19_09618 [Seiridium cardinale]|uniref:C2H2-type domain-containing protein n=1 Tax=Seiridium cardinale TaxID=138064 RepID=A0ABR2XF04_9PEZI
MTTVSHDRASDTESTGPGTPQSDADMTWDGAADEADEHHEHDRTEATFAHIDPSRELTREEREKWKRSGHKPGNYICPECGKGLSRIDSLTRHRRSRHRVGRQYFCRHPGCRRQTWGFGRFDNYRRHMESSHGVTIEPNDTEERHIAGRDATTDEAPKPPRVVSIAAQSAQAEKRGSYICIPLPAKPKQREPEHSKVSTNLTQPTVVPKERTITPPSSAFFGSLRPVTEDIRSLDKDELVRRLRDKTKECEELQQRNRILAMERDEYVEALRLSEEMRGA